MIARKPCDNPIEHAQISKIGGQAYLYLTHIRGRYSNRSEISLFMQNAKKFYLQSIYKVFKYLEADPGRGILDRKKWYSETGRLHTYRLGRCRFRHKLYFGAFYPIKRKICKTVKKKIKYGVKVRHKI